MGQLYRMAATYTGRRNMQVTSMPLVGFEPAIPAFQRVKIFHALDRHADRQFSVQEK
jgi:hypothetical protein